MNPRSRKEVESALQRQGFVKTNTDHQKYIYFDLAGYKTSIWTKISHGSKQKDISPDNLSKMAKQCRLTNTQFNTFINCPLTREQYEDMQRGKNIHGTIPDEAYEMVNEGLDSWKGSRPGRVMPVPRKASNGKKLAEMVSEDRR